MPRSGCGTLAEVFEEGLHRLLPLFPRTSLAWCRGAAPEAGAGARARGRATTSATARTPIRISPTRWRDVDPLDAEFERLAERVMGPLVAHRTEEEA